MGTSTSWTDNARIVGDEVQEAIMEILSKWAHGDSETRKNSGTTKWKHISSLLVVECEKLGLGDITNDLVKLGYTETWPRYLAEWLHRKGFTGSNDGN